MDKLNNFIESINCTPSSSTELKHLYEEKIEECKSILDLLEQGTEDTTSLNDNLPIDQFEFETKCRYYITEKQNQIDEHKLILNELNTKIADYANKSALKEECKCFY